MRIKDRQIIKLRKMGSRFMIVNPSSSVINLTDVYTLNESAAFLLSKCLECESFETADLAAWLIEEYGIDAELANADAAATADEWLRLELAESCYTSFRIMLTTHTYNVAGLKLPSLSNGWRH